MPLFHNSQIGCKISIKYIIKTDSAQRSDHLACYAVAGLYAELFAQRSTYSRRRIDDDCFIRVTQSLDHLIDIALLCQRPYRTYLNTLTAEGTNCLIDRQFKGRRNHCIKSTVYSRQSAHTLNLITNSFAAAAHNTFILITYDRRRRLILLIG